MTFTRREWTDPAEDQAVIAGWNAGLTLRAIGRGLNPPRSAGSIDKRRRALKLPDREQPRGSWTDERIAELRRLRCEHGLMHTEIGKLLGISWKTSQDKCGELGFRRPRAAERPARSVPRASSGSRAISIDPARLATVYAHKITISAKAQMLGISVNVLRRLAGLAGLTHQAVTTKGRIIQRPSKPAVKARAPQPVVVPFRPAPPPVAVDRSTGDLRFARPPAHGVSCCQWPHGDPREPEFRFCGDAVTHGPYCDRHYLMAYRQPGDPVEPSAAPRTTVPNKMSGLFLRRAERVSA